MHVLTFQQTIRLWDRLEREAIDYYRTAHDAKNQLLRIGPVRFDDEKIAQIFSDLPRQYRRLKHRFTVMALIGRPWMIPANPLWDGSQKRSISDLALGLSDQVIGLGVVKAELERRVQ